MQIKKILNSKEIEKLIEKNYGCKIKLKNLFITKNDKIWLAAKEINLNKIKKIKRCYRIGIYFGKLKRNNKIKLSIEGANIVGKKATKNVALINEKEAIKFIEGNDIYNFKEVNCELNNFIILKNGEDIIGVGILRNGYIENLIPKARRMKLL